MASVQKEIEERKLDGITYGQFRRFLEAETALRSLGITTDYSKISSHIPVADSVIPISKSYMFIYLDKPEEKTKYGVQRDLASKVTDKLEKHHYTCDLEKDRKNCIETVDTLVEIFQDSGERLSHRKRSTDAEVSRAQAELNRKLERITRKRERIGRDYEDIAVYVGSGSLPTSLTALTHYLGNSPLLDAAVALGTIAAETPLIVLAARNWTESRETNLDKKEDDAYRKYDNGLREAYAEQAFDFARLYLQTLAPWARIVHSKNPEGINYKPEFEANLQTLFGDLEKEKRHTLKQ